jgi:hypothetical protein
LYDKTDSETSDETSDEDRQEVGGHCRDAPR